MKNKRLLSALVISALAGVITIATANSANAADIYLQAGGDGTNDTWVSAEATNSGLTVVDKNGNGRDDGPYTLWTHTTAPGLDILTINEGGELDIIGLTNGNQTLNANSGSINVFSGALNIASGSYIRNDVVFAMATSGTLNITGGTVHLNNGTGSSGDRVFGNINMSSGRLYLNGGTNFGSSGKINATGGNLFLSGTNTLNSNTNIVEDAVIYVTGGTQTFATADSIKDGAYIQNGGVVKFQSGTINFVINNNDSTGTTQIAGNVQNNATINNNVEVLSGTFTNSSSNRGVRGTTTVMARAKAINSGTMADVTNSGTFTTNDGSITGAITNNKTLNITGGTAASVNNANATNSVATQSGGTVTGTVDNAGTYTLSGTGAIEGTVTNSGTFNLKNSGVSNYTQSAGTLNITDGASLTLVNDTDMITGGNVNIGDGTNESTLNLSNDSTIAQNVILKVAKESTFNINGTNAQATINTNDVWNGEINQTAGTLTILDNVVKNATTATLNSDGGNIVIGDILTSTAGTLNLNYLDSITYDTNVTINTNGTLNQSDGTVHLDEATDDWNGAISLSNIGSILLADFIAKETDGTLRYNQDGGIAMLCGTELTLNKDANNEKSIISDGYVELDTGSTLAGATLTILNGEENNATLSMTNPKTTLNVGNSSKLTLDSYIYTPATDPLLETEITYGTVNIGTGLAGDKSVLEVASGLIGVDANTNIAKGSALNITGTNASDADGIAVAVTLNGTDVWNGDINLSNASAGAADDANVSLILSGVNQVTGATATALGGTTPYYSQAAGTLALTNNTKLSVGDSSLINGGNLTIDSSSAYDSLSNGFTVANLQTAGAINGMNGTYENYVVTNEFKIGDGGAGNQANFKIDLYVRSNADVNYDTFGSDGIQINAANGTDAILNIEDIDISGDIFGWGAPIDSNINIGNVFKGNVNTAQDIRFTAADKEVLTPIGWYKFSSNGGNSYSLKLNKLNSGVYRGQISTIAQYQNQLAVGGMLFDHAMLDNGFKGNDYIASNPNRLASATDLYPPYQYSRKDGGLWVKMYGTFEKLNMNHGLNVGNNAYGTIIGADFGLKELKRGWQFMPTAYIAYNGAHQYWNGYGAYQNGGQLGVMGTWYKNNFMVGALAYGGVYGNEMNTPRGDDDTFNYFAGGSVKTAYNWRFAKDWSLQPNLLVAYNYFGQQNWHSDFGQMGMMSGMLHGVNIAPGINLIWEKETFSIYGTLQYMYNVNQSVGGRAGHVDLPNVHMDRGYIQYGIGVNKRFGDRFSGFLQAVIRNVGRTGIGLQAGFQWQLGKCSSNNSKAKGNVTPKLKDAKITLNTLK